MKCHGTIILTCMAIVLCGVFTGCGTIHGPLKGESISLSQLRWQSLEDDKSLVFGKIHISIGGADFKIPAEHFMIISLSDTEYSGWLSTYSSGGFYWRLPPGTYEISSISSYSMYEMSIISPQSMNMRFIEPTPLTFTVPEAGKAYYIGDLKIDIKGKPRSWWSDLVEGINDVEIVDNYVEAKNYVERQQRFWIGKIEKSLMNYDESIETEKIAIIKRSDSKYKSMRFPEEPPLWLRWVPPGIPIGPIGPIRTR